MAPALAITLFAGALVALALYLAWRRPSAPLPPPDPPVPPDVPPPTPSPVEPPGDVNPPVEP